MAAFFETEELRDRFIIAGINEIDTHGPEDFSLRRIAYACGVSCAAPYKHFKNKEGLIIEILDYINRQWKLLETQIIEVHKKDLKTLIPELAMANIRFRIANANSRFMFILNKEVFQEEKRKELIAMNGKIEEYALLYFEKIGLPKTLCHEKVMMLNAYINGIALMAETGTIANDAETFDIVKKKIEEELG